MRQFLTYLFILAAMVSQAQVDSVSVAYNALKEGDLARAQSAIDAAVADSMYAAEAQTWYIRGFIYKEVYNKQQRQNPRSEARNEAFNSFIRSMQLDPDTQYLADNRANLKYIAATYFNDATAAMQPDLYPDAIWCYDRFRDAMMAYDSTHNPVQRDIEFKNALASVYTKIYDVDPVANEAYFGKILELYKEVLAIDPNNISANYNLGILYYNKAVNIINSLDYDMDMFAFMEVQENCVEIFKQSLPFMEKAYELDPQRKETLVGLSGIYFSLNEMDKSEEIKRKIAEIEEK